MESLVVVMMAAKWDNLKAEYLVVCLDMKMVGWMVV